MSRIFESGEYIHIPSETYIFKMLGDGIITQHKKLIDRPQVLMCLGPSTTGQYYKVFYDGETYFIDKENAYEIGEKK